MASTDNIEDNTGFAEKNDATFPILADPEKNMSDSYGVLSMLGYAKRWTFYIDIDGIILKIDKGVSPSSAGKDLVMNLKELNYPKKS
jgi:peroxiredoxin Q/BCP